MSERPRLPRLGFGGRISFGFEFDRWSAIGDEALETKGLAKAGATSMADLELDFGLRGLEDLGFMFALRDFVMSLLFLGEEELEEETEADLPPEVNVLKLFKPNN